MGRRGPGGWGWASAEALGACGCQCAVLWSQVSHRIRDLCIWPSGGFTVSMEKLTGHCLCTTGPGRDIVVLSENGRPGVSAYCKGYFSACLERGQISDFFCAPFLNFHSLPHSSPQRISLLFKIGGRLAWAEKCLPMGVRAQVLAPILTSLLWLQVLLEDGGMGKRELFSGALVREVVKQQSSVCSF